MNEAAKRYSVRLLTPAQFDLEEIAQLYRSLAGAASARRITDAIYDALEQLSRFPLSGPVMRDRELAALGYRSIVVKRKYIVIYRLLGDTVFIYHIFDGRSDYPTLFRSELFS